MTDINDSPCPTAKKKATQSKLRNIDNDRIIVVIKEIESWYLAGLNDESSKELRIKHFRDTNNLTKEQFNNLMPPKFRSRIYFMRVTLDSFQIEIARRKNESFKYFFDKYDC